MNSLKDQIYLIGKTKPLAREENQFYLLNFVFRSSKQLVLILKHGCHVNLHQIMVGSRKFKNFSLTRLDLQIHISYVTNLLNLILIKKKKRQELKCLIERVVYKVDMWS